MPAAELWLILAKVKYGAMIRIVHRLDVADCQPLPSECPLRLVDIEVNELVAVVGKKE